MTSLGRLSVFARNLCVLLTVAIPLAAPLTAQRGEQDFKELAADTLHGYAKSCLASGYPKRARQVWLEVIHDYLPDHAESRKALGFLRAGSSWAPDPNFKFPDEETPDANAAKSLSKRWDKLCDELGAGHRDLAKRLADLGEAERSRYHYDRALRFMPDDKASVAASGLANEEGVLGTEVELTILRRTKQMQRLIEELKQKTYPAEQLPGSERQPLLDKGGVQYIGVQSDNFTIWGDFSAEILTVACQYAERSLEFCRTMMAGGDAFAWPVSGRHTMAFFEGKEKWEKVVQANADLFDPEFYAFMVKNARITVMGEGDSKVRIAGLVNQAEVEDFAVREVAQVIAGFKGDALHEGIGHAVVGMFFGRNLIFTIGQEREEGGTTTGVRQDDARFELPDLQVWKDLAAELAWERSDVPASKLPLYTSASFPNEARIKAWSFCDYLLRRQPGLLRDLDATVANGGATNTRMVDEAFAVEAKLALPQLDADWRAFWTRDTPVMRAIRNDKTPLATVSKTAPEFLAEFNAVRESLHKIYKTGRVGWVAKFSERCKDHAAYLKTNGSERGPEKEHTEQPKKKGFTAEGRDFAQRAIVATNAKKDFDELIAGWMDWPGYRDALINSALTNVGLYCEGSVAVMDVSRGILQAPNPTSFPVKNQRDVPTEVVVKELGADVADALAKHRKKKAKVIGYPLTFHFYKASSMPQPGTLEVTLKRGKDDLPGFVQLADNGTSRRTSAPGMIVFYPFEPLPRGSDLVLTWKFVDPEGRPETHRIEFKTR